jgi:hypothetical protein
MKGSLKNSKEFLKLSKPSAASNAGALAKLRPNSASKSAAASSSGAALPSDAASNPLLSSKLCSSLCRSSESELATKWCAPHP